MSHSIWHSSLPKTCALVICLWRESEKRGGIKGNEKVTRDEIGERRGEERRGERDEVGRGK